MSHLIFHLLTSLMSCTCHADIFSARKLIRPVLTTCVSGISCCDLHLWCEFDFVGFWHLSVFRIFVFNAMQPAILLEATIYSNQVMLKLELKPNQVYLPPISISCSANVAYSHNCQWLK